MSVPWLCTIWSVASLTLKKHKPQAWALGARPVSTLKNRWVLGKAVAEGTGSAHPRLHPVPWPGPSGTLQPLHTLPLAPGGASVYLSCFSLLIPVLQGPPGIPCFIFWPLLMLFPQPKTTFTPPSPG